MKRALSLFCILFLTLLPSMAEGRSGSRFRSQNYAIDDAGNVYWLVNYSRPRGSFLFSWNEDWSEIYRLSPKSMACEKVAEHDHGLRRIDACGDDLYIEAIQRKYDLFGVEATVAGYRIPIARISNGEAWEAYKEEKGRGVFPDIHEGRRFLTCMDRLFVMDGDEKTLFIVEDNDLRPVAECLDIYSQYDTFLELRDSQEHLDAAQTRIYDPAGDRIMTLPFSPMALNNDCALLDGDALYQIRDDGLTRYDLLTGQTETLCRLPGDISFHYGLCMEEDHLFILNREQRMLNIWSISEGAILNAIRLPEDFALDGPVFAVSGNVAVFYDNGEVYEDRLQDTLKKTFYMLDVNTGEVTVM